MSGPNEEWWGRYQTAAELDAKRAAVARRTACVLGVPLSEIVVTERRETSGIALIAHWHPGQTG